MPVMIVSYLLRCLLPNICEKRLLIDFYYTSSASSWSSSSLLIGYLALAKMANGSSISISSSKLSLAKSSSLLFLYLSIKRSFCSSSVIADGFVTTAAWGTIVASDAARAADCLLACVNVSSSAARCRSSYRLRVCFKSSSWSTLARRLLSSLTSFRESISSISRLELKPLRSTRFIASLSSSS